MSQIVNIKILSGIPGCGKSTWARNYVANTRNVIRINRDDLRHILVEDFNSEGNESIINKSKLALIKTAIEFDRNIVLDDTHCYKDYLIFLIDFIRKTGEEFNKTTVIEILDFDVDSKICIERNENRDSKVPVIAIYHMISQKKEIIYDELLIDNYIKMSSISNI